MSIPLDRLYHFINQVAGEIYGKPVVIIRFSPHGSKNIQDLLHLQIYTWLEQMLCPTLWCNDQEPLQYDFYSQNLRVFGNENPFRNLLRSVNLGFIPKNLNYYNNVLQKNILLHSEKRSQNVEKYISADALLPVYYWSHALIAKDWFRYARYQDFKDKKIEKIFLIYSRAWSGTREYRLKFSDLLIEHGLVDQCRSFCNPVEGNLHYKDHNFANECWQPNHVLEHYFLPSMTKSHSSADFDTKDYLSTEIEVVLETLFDDDRLHLTEKSLRPIACCQPFILVSTHGSLEYLRSYGFKTFDTVWDESYDKIEDPLVRMQAIISLMRDIVAWTPKQKLDNLQKIQLICDHNQKYFFKKDFSNLIVNELRDNLRGAFDKIVPRIYGSDSWLHKLENTLEIPTIKDFLHSNHDTTWPTIQQYQKVFEFVKHYSKTVANANKI